MGLNPKMINGAILGIVILVVLFSAYTAILPTAQTAGSSMNDTMRCRAVANSTGQACTYSATGCWTNADVNVTCAYTSVPLGNMFSGTGIVFLIIMAALIVLVVKSFLPSGK